MSTISTIPKWTISKYTHYTIATIDRVHREDEILAILHKTPKHSGEYNVLVPERER